MKRVIGGLLTVFATLASAQTAGNWTEQMPKTSPSGRCCHAMAYDSAHAQVVMFGGFAPGNFGSGSEILSDTWVWDGTNWTRQVPQTFPSQRRNFSMAYDAARSQVVLFGGYSGSTDLNETWVWDGANWTQKSPQASPSPRSSSAMAYDSAHGQVVLFGGNTGLSTFGDTWVWDGTNWTQESPQTSPPARQNHAMAFDSARSQIVLFGGSSAVSDLNDLNDTWVWDGSNWTQKSLLTSPPAAPANAMAYDVAHGQVVLLKGYRQTGFVADTWLWDGTNWAQQLPQTSPLTRTDAAMAYDSAHSRVVLFGGQGLNDTWIWSGGPLPAPAITAVVNGASFVGGGVVAGEIATAFGTNLTSGTGINLTSSLPLPTTFLNDSLIVNNQPIALFAVDNFNGQQQINFQVPWGVASGPTATVAVENNGAMGAAISVPVLAAQPGIFNYSVGGKTFGAILHANFQLADTAHPAKAREIVLVYCTGLGAVGSPPADGAPGSGQPTTTTPTVMIGTASSIVSFSGLAPGFVGLYQINVEVPDGLARDNYPVVVTLAGASSNSVLLPVQ